MATLRETLKAINPISGGTVSTSSSGLSGSPVQIAGLGPITPTNFGPGIGGTPLRLGPVVSSGPTGIPVSVVGPIASGGPTVIQFPGGHIVPPITAPVFAHFRNPFADAGALHGPQDQNVKRQVNRVYKGNN